MAFYLIENVSDNAKTICKVLGLMFIYLNVYSYLWDSCEQLYLYGIKIPTSQDAPQHSITLSGHQCGQTFLMPIIPGISTTDTCLSKWCFNDSECVTQ